jgi:hypothetical protein
MPHAPAGTGARRPSIQDVVDETIARLDAGARREDVLPAPLPRPPAPPAPPPMRVRDLIARLQQEDPDALVVLHDTDWGDKTMTADDVQRGAFTPARDLFLPDDGVERSAGDSSAAAAGDQVPAIRIKM